MIKNKMRIITLYRLINWVVLILFFLMLISANIQAAQEYVASSSYSKATKNIQIVNLPQNAITRDSFLFLSALGFFNTVARPKINPSDTLSKEEALSVILSSVGKQQDAFVRAEKLELKRPSGQKLVKPYNYLYLGYIQLAYDMKILSKKEYQDAMTQVQPSEKEHEKMTKQLIKKNDDTIAKAVYEGRPYSYDDLIFVRSAPATRQEVCLWVVKAFKIPIIYENLAKTYPDYDRIDSKFLSSINTLLKNGVLIGRSDGYLHPDDYITYEELAFILGSLKPNILSANGLKEVRLEVKDIRKFNSDKMVLVCEDDNRNDVNITVNPGKQDFGVITDGNFLASSYLQRGDYVAFYVNSKNEVVLASILQRPGQENIKGVISRIDAKKMIFSVKLPDGNVYNLSLSPKATIYDSNSGKSLDFSELNVGNLVQVKVQKDRADAITLLSLDSPEIERVQGIISRITKDRIVLSQNGQLTEYLLSPDTVYIDKGDFSRVLSKNDFYEGMKVLAGTVCGYLQYLSTTYDEKSEDIVSGILHEVDSNLGYLEIYNQQGEKKSYRFSKKLGLKVKKDGQNSSLDSLLPGDVVFLYFNGDFVRTVTASSNLQQKVAKIENVVRNLTSGLPQKIIVNIDGRIYGPYEINSDVEVIKNGIPAALKDIMPGQYVKLTGSFFGNSAYIRRIEISGNEYVKNIYIAKGTVNGNVLYLSDIQILRNNAFEPLYTWLSFQIPSDLKFILDGSSLAPLSKLQNLPVVVVTKERFSQEVLDTIVAISRGSFTKIQGEVSMTSSNSVVISGNRYSIGNKTYTVANGLLIPASFKVGDEIIGIASQGSLILAKQQEGISKPIFVRGQVQDISELEYITVKDYVYLDGQRGWQYVPSKLTLFYDTQTVLCDVYGLSSPKEILNLKNKSVYIIHNGKYANVIIDTSFGGYIVTGVVGKDMKILNAQYNDMMTQTWNRIDKSFVLDTTQTILLDANGNLRSEALQFGDRVLLLVPQNSFDLSKSSMSPAVVLVNY
ncbi:S-layer domain-containing protein [Caldicellulosiruptor kronotskyensis 2002]|uniref:S-layer domain-containing protein n=1 Tax=Caldicellulosiruptor kronotskyensis (strain DSM 18902 / VKM B-2412 / 2002) TaxID=632348 RepID=E4SD57_CALK2|nr:S-layer homology domain-containing protein [Caldicellulosiruptor kronotskyensis]ADQ45121.1 S-layer domain-containing protein [Caldicellulosiruptor kronotskyensis 2002]